MPKSSGGWLQYRYLAPPPLSKVWFGSNYKLKTLHKFILPTEMFIILGRFYHADVCSSAHCSDQVKFNQLFGVINRNFITDSWALTVGMAGTPELHILNANDVNATPWQRSSWIFCLHFFTKRQSGDTSYTFMYISWWNIFGNNFYNKMKVNIEIKIYSSFSDVFCGNNFSFYILFSMFHFGLAMLYFISAISSTYDPPYCKFLSLTFLCILTFEHHRRRGRNMTT